MVWTSQISSSFSTVCTNCYFSFFIIVPQFYIFLPEMLTFHHLKKYDWLQILNHWTQKQFTFYFSDSQSVCCVSLGRCIAFIRAPRNNQLGSNCFLFLAVRWEISSKKKSFPIFQKFRQKFDILGAPWKNPII